MGFESQFYQFANSVSYPISYLLIGPIVLAVALHIVRTASAKKRVYKSGTWEGVEAKTQVNTTASLLSLIFIVVFCAFAFNPKSASAFGTAVKHQIAVNIQ